MNLPLSTAALSAVLFLTGCVADDTLRREADRAPESLDLVINVAIPRLGGYAASRAEAYPTQQSEPAECVVDDMLLLVMTKGDDDNSRRLIKALSVNSADIHQGSQSVMVEATFAVPEDHRDADGFFMAVVANGARFLSSASTALSPGATYSSIRNALIRDWSPATPPAAPTLSSGLRFDMWAEFNIRNVESQSVGDVSMLRDMARVDITLADGNENLSEKFQITDAYIYRRGLHSQSIPDKTADNFFSWKTALGVAGKNADGAYDTWHYSLPASSSGFVNAIYIPEAKVELNTDGTPDTPGDSNHLNRPAVVVGGYYGGDVSKKVYYRIDFQRPVSTTNPDGESSVEYVLTDVVRNHLYKIVIEDVTGPGNDDPDPAYEEVSVKINAAIIDWTLFNSYIVWDPSRVHYISFQTRRPVMNALAGLATAVEFESDLDPTTWNLAWKDGSSPLFDFTLSVDERNDNGPYTGTLTFSTKSAMEKGAPDRSDILTFSADGLNGSLLPTQRAYFGPAWSEGGDVRVDDI